MTTAARTMTSATAWCCKGLSTRPTHRCRRPGDGWRRAGSWAGCSSITPRCRSTSPPAATPSRGLLQGRPSTAHSSAVIPGRGTTSRTSVPAWAGAFSSRTASDCKAWLRPSMPWIEWTGWPTTASSAAALIRRTRRLLSARWPRPANPGSCS